jgi:hypothetical protein
MDDTGRLLLVERVIRPGNAPSFARLMDLNMLVVAGGQERTEAEYRALYERAGLALSGVVATGVGVSIIEGATAGAPASGGVRPPPPPAPRARRGPGW